MSPTPVAAGAMSPSSAARVSQVVKQWSGFTANRMGTSRRAGASVPPAAGPPPPPPGPVPADALRAQPLNAHVPFSAPPSAPLGALAFALSPRDVGALSAAFETQVGALHAEYSANASRIDRVLASAVSHSEDNAPSSSSPALAVAVVTAYRELNGAYLKAEAERARLFVAEAFARRELAAAVSTFEAERDAAMREIHTSQAAFMAARRDAAVLASRLDQIEAAHQLETDAHEREIDALRDSMARQIAQEKANAAALIAAKDNELVAAVSQAKAASAAAVAETARAAGLTQVTSPRKGGKSIDLRNNSRPLETEGVADVLEALASEVSTLRASLGAATAEARSSADKLTISGMQFNEQFICKQN